MKACDFILTLPPYSIILNIPNETRRMDSTTRNVRSTCTLFEDLEDPIRLV